jgi:hypothetical protein
MDKNRMVKKFISAKESMSRPILRPKLNAYRMYAQEQYISTHADSLSDYSMPNIRNIV